MEEDELPAWLVRDETEVVVVFGVSALCVFRALIVG